MERWLEEMNLRHPHWFELVLLPEFAEKRRMMNDRIDQTNTNGAVHAHDLAVEKVSAFLSLYCTSFFLFFFDAGMLS